MKTTTRKTTTEFETTAMKPENCDFALSKQKV